MAINFLKSNIIPENQIVYIYDLIKNIVAPGNRAFFSPEIQKYIDEVLDRRLPKDWRKNEQFRKKLSLAFWKNQFSSYDGKYFPDYYAAYYIPNNIYKIQLMLLELFRLGKISFSENKIRVLDIGSSVGTTAWALYDFYQILVNVLDLYGLHYDKLPIMEIDSIEKYQNNIDFFEELREKISAKPSKLIISKPIKADVLDGGMDNLNLKKYDVVIASNIISEFPSYKHQLQFAETIIDNIKKNASFILLETAYLKDTKSLKKIQFKLSQKQDVNVVSPCGKINGFSKRCNNCYSFRKESLKIPETMKLFSTEIDESDENEKLKWSYTIFSKQIDTQDIKLTGYPSLNEISKNIEKDTVSVEAEIISSRIDRKGDDKFYYLKICDQSEDKEQFILKIPKYFELPKYHFGDIVEIKDAKIEKIEWSKPNSITSTIIIDPRRTTVNNKSELSEPRGLVAFKNVKESNVLFFLKRFFNPEWEFNEGQYEILEKVLKNEDVLGILATGGGKSITFQLPALLKPGVSIIVSPLKSLMDDQVHGLQNRFGFDFVDRIHSGVPLQEKERIFHRFKNGRLKILYIAPERLQQKSFQQELKRLIEKGININYFPIDEAHCISEWGHDFRPSYARLKTRQQDLPHIDGKYPSIVALTATASYNVQKDVIRNLSGIEDRNLLDDIIKGNSKSIKDDQFKYIHRIIDRKELSLEVIPMKHESTTGKYTIKYRDPISKDDFLEHSFQKGTMRHDVLKYILSEVLPDRFVSFDIKKDAGLIFTIYADPKPASEMAESSTKKIAIKKNIENDTEEYQNLLKKETYDFFKSDRCRESEGARWLSKYLNKQGINNKPWFSTIGYRKDRSLKMKQKLEKEWEKIKTNTQEKYINNELNLLVSTKGFGMGIDKPNIRYIIHFGFPDSLESYFQQIGRAGRDRQHSHCILLWDAPTSECELFLKENKIPECFIPDETTGKLQFNACPYGRIRGCDYAKQIYFIESGYPTVEELQSAIEYLKNRAKNQDTYPWVYLKKKYLKNGIAKNLEYEDKNRSQINELLIIETLFTLKYIYEFSQTYLEINIKRKTTMRTILNSTNSEIVKEHIELLDKIYPGFLDKPPSDKFRTFNIADYVQKIRYSLNIEIFIDEVVQFFNILNERNDVEVTKNYIRDFGYEIKLNKEMLTTKVKDVEHLKKVTEWKSSQYIMLENIVKYANLEPFTATGENKNSMCRRSHIMTVFGTEGAKVGKDIRCNYCDCCGYHNSWDEKANDIIADFDEQQFRLSFRDFYSKQSNNKDYLNNNINNLFELVDQMIKNNYSLMVETISDAWLEQIGEVENPATNLILSIIHYLKGNSIQYSRYLKVVFESIEELSIRKKVVRHLYQFIGIDPMNIYKEQFQKTEPKINLLEIFSSKGLEEFENIETTIGLEITNIQINKFKSVLEKYEKMEVKWISSLRK